MTQNEVSICKAAERGDAVASLSEANAADGNSGKSFGEIGTCQYTSRHTLTAQNIRLSYPALSIVDVPRLIDCGYQKQPVFLLSLPCSQQLYVLNLPYVYFLPSMTLDELGHISRSPKVFPMPVYFEKHNVFCIPNARDVSETWSNSFH